MHEVRKLPMSEPVLKFAKLTDKAFTPTRGSKQAAGFDLYRFVLPILKGNFVMKAHLNEPGVRNTQVLVGDHLSSDVKVENEAKRF